MKLEALMEKVSPWDSALSYLERIGVLHYERYAPFFLSSIGAHVANLKNKMGKPFYCIGGKVEDLRLHLFFIAPPSFGKSYYDLLFFDKRDGIAASIPNHHLDKITEAGLVGSVDEEKEYIGLAEEKPDAVVWADEFAGVSKQGMKQHSIDLEETLLSLLSDGHVSKRMKHGLIEFDSYITLWAATQSERVQLASGFPRRFCFLDGLPNSKDLDAFRTARRKATGVFPDSETISELQGQFDRFAHVFQVEAIKFCSDYYSFLDTLHITHGTEQVFERLAVGYHAIRTWKPGDSVLSVFMDETLEEMFRQEARWRVVSQRNLTDAQILRFFEDQAEWELTPLKRWLEQIGISWERSTKAIGHLEAIRVLGEEKRTKPGSRKPTTILSRGPEFENYGEWLE